MIKTVKEKENIRHMKNFPQR